METEGDFGMCYVTTIMEEGSEIAGIYDAIWWSRERKREMGMKILKDFGEGVFLGLSKKK